MKHLSIILLAPCFLMLVASIIHAILLGLRAWAELRARDTVAAKPTRTPSPAARAFSPHENRPSC